MIMLIRKWLIYRSSFFISITRYAHCNYTWCKTLSNMHMFTSQFTQHNKVYLAYVKLSLYYTLFNTEYRGLNFNSQPFHISLKYIFHNNYFVESFPSDSFSCRHLNLVWLFKDKIWILNLFTAVIIYKIDHKINTYYV